MSDGVTRHIAEEVGMKSVLTALDLLDCFTDAEELGVSDVARRLGAQSGDGGVSILDTTDRMRLSSQRTARLVVQAGNVFSRLPGL